MNTPQALAVVWEMIKSNIPSQDKYDLLLDFDDVLGLKLSELPQAAAEVDSAQGKLIDNLRAEKKYGEADALRSELISKGYSVETTSSGTVVKKSS